MPSDEKDCTGVHCEDGMMEGFGLAAMRDEGTPLDPVDALLLEGLTEKQFMAQQVAFFEYRRAQGDTDEELSKHPYYLPPENNSR
jgi:hypothetical protein